MARLLSTLLVLGLLGGSAVAFAVTERLKLTPTPILRTKVDKVFSPVCRCRTARAQIRFTLRRADDVTVHIVDGDGVVRTLARQRAARGDVVFAWDGRGEGGALLPEGAYRPRVQLANERRTIELPNPIRIDVTPPETTIVSIVPRVFTPGVGKLKASYRVSEQARAVLYANGIRRVGPSWFYPLTGKLDWYGRARGRDLPAGTYRIQLAAIDLAGNAGERTRPVTVRIRYLDLARRVVRARPGGRVVVRYEPAVPVRWRLARRSGFGRGGRVVLRAPAEPGRYGLFLLRRGHAARVSLIVAPRGR